MNFKQEFLKALNELHSDGLDWGLVGILTRKSKVYTLSYDSKILSGIFEILCEPVIMKLAETNSLDVKKSLQNQYPEFTLCDLNFPDQKIAIDIKSTYRQRNILGIIKPFGFTLGSYRSYLKDPLGKKGILFPYSEYKEHWVIGFLYDRNPLYDKTEIKEIIEAAQLQPPYSNIEFFIQEKYKIAGKTTGSGNTTNIGSIKSRNLSDFEEGNGPFKSISEFEEYWKNY